MKSIKNLKIGFIGYGRVARVFVFFLKKKGFQIKAISDKKMKNFDNIKVAKNCDLIFVATPDKEIKKVYLEIENYLKPNTYLGHFSGSLPGDILNWQKKKKNIHLFSLHPILTFGDFKKAIKYLPKTYFALEGTKKGKELAKNIVKEISNKYFYLNKKDKPLYHLMCTTTNFLFPLFYLTFQIAKKLKISKKTLYPLVKATIENIFEKEIKKIITGPARRKEKSIINLHKKVLKKYFPNYFKMYDILTKTIMEIVKNR
ncbi:MAG: DUF2520 domain-containing protein [candidate division WOR-3 bacterium]|nr:DUF2520 domain-containing protein [candidate division WOR-3 bacterium]MCX7836638.1 DUF2520 domain-containing protein [candidate division WOR-3 bacterium]MDW8113314.1 DUF2520 domain-containing protein [candidate division WOR-3 bacterium]